MPKFDPTSLTEKQLISREIRNINKIIKRAENRGFTFDDLDVTELRSMSLNDLQNIHENIYSYSYKSVTIAGIEDVTLPGEEARLRERRIAYYKGRGKLNEYERAEAQEYYSEDDEFYDNDSAATPIPDTLSSEISSLPETYDYTPPPPSYSDTMDAQQTIDYIVDEFRVLANKIGADYDYDFDDDIEGAIEAAGGNVEIVANRMREAMERPQDSLRDWAETYYKYKYISTASGMYWHERAEQEIRAILYGSSLDAKTALK